jgi:hypothetical protein
MIPVYISIVIYVTNYLEKVLLFNTNEVDSVYFATNSLRLSTFCVLLQTGRGGWNAGEHCVGEATL